MKIIILIIKIKIEKNEENVENLEKDNLKEPQDKKETSQDREKNYLNQISTIEQKIKGRNQKGRRKTKRRKL